MTRNAKNNQKGVAHIAFILAILAGLGVTVYLAVQSQVFRVPEAANIPAEQAVEFPAEEVTTEVPAVQNEADLDSTLEDLENTNVDQINEMLFQNEEDVENL